MSDQTRDSGAAGTILLAFVLGAVAGAAVALLVAPATGRETREFLSEKTKEGVRKAKDVYARAKDVVEENA